MKRWFRSHYWSDSDAKTAFKRFLIDIHGLDLSLWDAEGFWDDDYIPFSCFEDGNLVSSVCLYSLPMVVNGEERRIAQISSVGTLPSHRRQGLNRELTRQAREWCDANDHEFTFLFADEEAIPFYEACGFTAAPQYRYTLAPPPVETKSGGIAHLNVDGKFDRPRLLDLVGSRRPVSHTLGHRSVGLQMFHILYTLRDCLSYIADLDLIVAARPAKNTLFIYDLIGTEIPRLEELQPYLQSPGIDSYEFGFVPDRLGIEPAIEPNDNGDGTHIDGQFPFEGTPFRFPYTAHA